MNTLFEEDSTAVISPCGLFRYRLERVVAPAGLVFANFGINGSTASATVDDQTCRKWMEFTRLNGGRKFIVGNPFAFRSTDVRELARARDPIGPDNAAHLRAIIRDADVLVPCWGSRMKIPPHMRPRLDEFRFQLFAAGKPVKVFGFTESGDPKHPLMLGYDTPLQTWEAA